jgi:uncharacterized membrane protein
VVFTVLLGTWATLVESSFHWLCMQYLSNAMNLSDHYSCYYSIKCDLTSEPFGIVGVFLSDHWRHCNDPLSGHTMDRLVVIIFFLQVFVCHLFL